MCGHTALLFYLFLCIIMQTYIYFSLSILYVESVIPAVALSNKLFNPFYHIQRTLITTCLPLIQQFIFLSQVYLIFTLHITIKTLKYGSYAISSITQSYTNCDLFPLLIFTFLSLGHWNSWFFFRLPSHHVRGGLEVTSPLLLSNILNLAYTNL